MKTFRMSGYALSICASAVLGGCASSHSSAWSPVSAVPNAMSVGARAASGTEQVLYNFSGSNDGGNAATGLILDVQGNLYGTAVVGGDYGCGTAFKLTPQSGPPWTETVLHSFTCYSDGKNPHGGVTFDPQGNLVGTTVAGGSGGVCTGDGCGVVFRLSSTTVRVLHSFTEGHDGFGPGGGVTLDPSGNLFGTTPDGGANSQGVVYEVSRAGMRWRERVIHAFTGGKDGGVGSLGLLLRDGSGNLYGVTELGGAHSAGTVFKLSPTPNHRWKLTTLYAFKGAPDAAFPYGGLVADGSGNLYGTTYYGGTGGVGSVFELARGSGGYQERVLYNFKGGSDGSSSTSTLAFGNDGALYGTTSAGGGSCDCGTIFKVNPVSGKEKVLHSFGGSHDGAYSYYGLTMDTSGNFYGTTVAGGNFNQGTVFEYTP
jgi:uncharacterized repeat protein (TIGR03803 family)